MSKYKKLIELISDRFFCDPATAEQVVGIAKGLNADFMEQDQQTFDFILAVSYRFLSLSSSVEELKRELREMKEKEQFNS